VTWLIWVLVAIVALFIAMGVYLATVLKWEEEQTVGLKYYGDPG
jgi:hypothetical protein